MLSDLAISAIAAERTPQPLTGTDMDRAGTGGSAKRSISRERFVALIVRCERRVRVFVSTIHPKRSDVDEIVQDACMVAWKKLSSFRYIHEQPDDEFVRWLCTIARYEASKYRKLSAPPLVLDEEVIEKLATLQFDQADYFETRHAALLECIEKLRTRDKELIQRRYQDEMAARDLAEWVGRSVDAVYKSLNRIRMSLVACVERALKREGYN